MASYATIPANVEAEKPLLHRDVRVNLKTIIGGAAIASFLLGVLAATAVQSASTPLTTNFRADAEWRAAQPDGYYPSVQLMINPTNTIDRHIVTVHPDDTEGACLTMPMDQIKRLARGEESRVTPVMHRCYDKSAEKNGQLFDVVGHSVTFTADAMYVLCLTADSDSLWFERCEDEGWEKKFTFDKEPTAPSHGAGIKGQIKGSDGKCFGVDDLVTPVMTSCDDSDETTGKTDYLVDNSWYLIEHD